MAPRTPAKKTTSAAKAVPVAAAEPSIKPIPKEALEGAIKDLPNPPDNPTSDPVVVVPAAPKKWTASTLTAFLSGLIAFVLGLLTLAGTILPASVSPDVQVIVGILTALAGLVTPIVVFLTRAGVVKAGLLAGLSHDEAISVSRRV